MSLFSSREFQDRLSGSTIVGDEELVVSFDYREWSEGHPCGDTTAYERLSEIDGEEYTLDGETMEYERLEEILGEETARGAVERAIDNAISNM